jgi:multiple sugar transport system permease protein
MYHPRRRNAPVYVALSAATLLFVGPFAYALYTSVLPKDAINTLVGPSRFTVENYIHIFMNSQILRWYGNTIFMTAGILAGNLVVNTMAGFALAKLPFPGRTIAFIVIISTMMIPYQIAIIPIYSMIVNLGWLNSFRGLIFPFLFQGFLTFLMRQFFLSLPDDLMDAARIDGLSVAGAFLRIAIPLTTSALAVQTIFSFTGTWNSFIWPVTLVNDSRYFVLTVGMNTLKNRYFEWANITMAGIVLVTVPVVAVFASFQKKFVQSLAMSGIKG